MPLSFRTVRAPRVAPWFTVIVILAASFWLGKQGSTTLLVIAVGAIFGIALLARPILGLPAILLSALVIPLSIPTGTDVKLYPVVFVTAAVIVTWVGRRIRGQNISITRSPANLPLSLFLLLGLLSLVIGNATWSPAVLRRDSFLLVQLAQWSIFALSAGAFWLTANLVRSSSELERLTWLFLCLAGCVALLFLLPSALPWIWTYTTGAFSRTPLWVLLAALAGGQLFFNRNLSRKRQIFLVAVSLSILHNAFVQQREGVSNWIGVSAVYGTLIWLRWAKLRLPIVVLIITLTVIGFLLPTLYDFAGGDIEWEQSGAARLALMQRVIEVTMRNPFTGLGPAAYRPYANIEPFLYGRALWIAPQINSHNNYIDLFSHVGILGLAMFGWFVVALWRQGVHARQRCIEGFASGYINGMLAAGASSLVIMLLLDWMLPFVYNVGIYGFQASVLVWLFLGGIVVLDQLADVARTGEQAVVGVFASNAVGVDDARP